MGWPFRTSPLLILCLSACTCLTHVNGQELASDYWDVGAWTPGAEGTWPRTPHGSDTTSRALDLQGFAAAQYSPGAMLRGAFWNWPSAGGVGWQLGMTWDWKHDRFFSRGHAEHWRVAGVHADDWNEAWQWATWDGLGWAWNPNAADIALARMVGTVGCQISPSVVIEAGNHRHHWGKGWRSLWLDRQAAPLPFARLVVNTERLEYTHMVARTQHRTVGSPPDFPGSGQWSPGTYVNKRASWMACHTIQVDLGAGWSGSLFGAVTWLANDSGYTHRFEPVYALPVISFRPAEYALGSADNALIGAGLAWVPEWAHQTVQFSGQLMLDELVISEVFSPDQWWANKWGILGTVAWESPSKTWGGLVEACAVRPYTYAHASPAQSWTHNHQPLAHPAGSNFIEGRTHIRWERGPWHAHVGLVLRQQGIDEATDLGKEPAFSVGADPLLPYTTRPADYGVNMLYTGDGSAGETDLIRQRLLWADLGWDIPRLEDQHLFVRIMQNHRKGAIEIQNWWRVECGIRLNRVLEERNW